MEIVCVTVDAADPERVAAFWNAALRWGGVIAQPDGGGAICGPSAGGSYLEFVRVPEAKAGKNRLHLGCSAGSLADLDAEIERLEALGARVAWEEQFPESNCGRLPQCDPARRRTQRVLLERRRVSRRRIRRTMTTGGDIQDAACVVPRNRGARAYFNTAAVGSGEPCARSPRTASYVDEWAESGLDYVRGEAAGEQAATGGCGAIGADRVGRRVDRVGLVRRRAGGRRSSARPSPGRTS